MDGLKTSPWGFTNFGALPGASKHFGALPRPSMCFDKHARPSVRFGEHASPRMFHSLFSAHLGRLERALAKARRISGSVMKVMHGICANFIPRTLSLRAIERGEVPLSSTIYLT